MKYSSFIRACLVLVSTVFLAHGAPAKTRTEQQQVQLEGLTVTLSLVKRTPTLTKKDWPKEPFSLTAESVSVNQRTIYELLKAAHIFPDVEAFALVYVINPDVRALREIKVSQIRIPKIVGGPQLEAAFTEGFVVLLTVEREKKELFNAKVLRLKQLVESVSNFGPEKFQDMSVHDVTIASLKTTSGILGGINQRVSQRFGRPISSEGLSQLIADVDLLSATLTNKTEATAKILKADEGKILSIEKDVRIKGRAFSEVAAGDAPDAPPDVLVIVKTLKAGNQVPNLRIYYVPEALKDNNDDVRPFGVLSSPSNKKIPEADYCFWAAIDPSHTPVTNVLCLEIRQAAPSDIQLTVIH